MGQHGSYWPLSFFFLFWRVYGPRRSLAGHERVVKTAPSCKHGWPITVQNLVHLARSQS